MHCPHCGIIIEDKWVFCPKCSNSLTISNQPQLKIQSSQQEMHSHYTTITSDKNRNNAINFCLASMACVILGFIFHFPLLILAGGLHRFYVGKMFSGFFYSITGGFIFIGLIFDFIQLQTGQFTDNVGHPLRK